MKMEILLIPIINNQKMIEPINNGTVTVPLKLDLLMHLFCLENKYPKKEEIQSLLV